MKRLRRMDLQAKVSLVLAAVIIPTFLIVTIAQNKLTQPLLEEEIRQIGINAAKTLGAEIVSSRLLSLPEPGPAIETRMQDILYSQPNIVRIDVLVRDPATGVVKNIASNVDDEGAPPTQNWVVNDSVTSEFKIDESSGRFWEILVPIAQKSRDPRGPKRVLGSIHLVISMGFISRLIDALWRTTAVAAIFSVVILIAVLSYFLRKTISNDRLLRQAESQNIQLTEKLHDAHRQLLNTEKLAVMGQLTASFAHEIGTPLNAIGGHLQLLRDEVGTKDSGAVDRLEIINGQVSKIEKIVKNFLQSTAKPSSQTQLVDLNSIADKTLGIVRPRSESLGVEVRRELDRGMGPVRAVPLEIEQVLLNLVNNSLDSLSSKRENKEKSRLLLEISSKMESSHGKQWAEISVYDTGEGISKEHLKRVLKPFFTTKRPGEGTGLGLTICQEIAHKYGGELEIDSKEGAWTRATLKLPYQVKQ